jgi:hypothetical protein
MRSIFGEGRSLARIAGAAALAGALGLTAACETAPAQPKGPECRARTQQELRQRGLSPSETRIYFSDARVRGRNDQVAGYSNWVRLEGCDGSLVFVYNQACQLRRAYGRDGCELPPER